MILCESIKVTNEMKMLVSSLVFFRITSLLIIIVNTLINTSVSSTKDLNRAEKTGKPELTPFLGSVRGEKEPELEEILQTFFWKMNFGNFLGIFCKF